jgi:membrane protease YdiL (CAAX protease family)
MLAHLRAVRRVGILVGSFGTFTHPLMPSSPSLTVVVLLVCFTGAVAAFLGVSVKRWLAARRQALEPPPLPVGKVAIWPYHLIDWVWMGFLVLAYGAVSISNAQFADKGTETTISAAGLIQSIGFQLVLAGMTVVVMIWRIRPIAWLGLNWPGWRWVLLIGPVSVLAIWALNASLMFSGFMKWIETLGVEPMQDSVKLLLETTDPMVLGLMAVAAVVVAPVCEEIMFRGYLYPAAKRFAGPWVAGIGSALIFAAAHGSLAPLLPLFAFGCLLVLAYEMTGSLWAPIAMHFCFNGATVLIQLAVRFSGIPIPENL